MRDTKFQKKYLEAVCNKSYRWATIFSVTGHIDDGASF